MITRAEADAVAAAWARSESLAEGREHQATVEEFDLGFAVKVVAARRLFSPSGVGAGWRVVDRATGRVSNWPNWPFETLQGVYREQRGDIVDPPRTADPEVQLRREIHRRPAPGIAAHATVQGRVYIARGAKGDQKLNHHPLVLERLAEQTPQEKVRGCERHAEMLVCSDALHDLDRRRGLDGLPPLTLDEARQALGESLFETFQILEPGAENAGEPNTPCPTCSYVLTQLALLPWGSTAALMQDVAPEQPNPDPARFSDLAAAELLNGRWKPETPYRVRYGMAEVMAGDTVKAKGREHRHELFPAVLEAFGITGKLLVKRRAPGLEQRVQLFEIWSMPVRHTADVLYELGQVIGARLFPLGRVNFESVLAIDEHGRVFHLDQAGEWFVADSYVEALETLIQGRRTYRVRDDGTWG
ncbi:SUKH-3 domain-containing protein [Actinoplanes sp. NPDC026670]|uniref:SUKH-3 domain-containing protein n=1 Tax=Actinoplanes sp. NPDC026670 TaxID=3154700 RepID=UPI0033DF53EA